MKKRYAVTAKIRLLNGDIIPLGDYIGDREELFMTWRKKAIKEYYNSKGYDVSFTDRK